MLRYTVLLALDLAGTFAFGLNGEADCDSCRQPGIVGVVTLGPITALGGCVIRDVLLGALPPATFLDWRYLARSDRRGVHRALPRRTTWTDVVCSCRSSSSTAIRERSCQVVIDHAARAVPGLHGGLEQRHQRPTPRSRAGRQEPGGAEQAAHVTCSGNVGVSVPACLPSETQ
jgi:hypothetical protein